MCRCDEVETCAECRRRWRARSLNNPAVSTGGNRTTEMTDRIIEKCRGENGYRVRRPGCFYSRVFLWGEFDCGTVTWQRALADARRYARTGEMPKPPANYFA